MNHEHIGNHTQQCFACVTCHMCFLYGVCRCVLMQIACLSYPGLFTLLEQINNQEQYSRRICLIFEGIKAEQRRLVYWKKCIKCYPKGV